MDNEDFIPISVSSTETYNDSICRSMDWYGDLSTTVYRPKNMSITNAIDVFGSSSAISTVAYPIIPLTYPSSTQK